MSITGLKNRQFVLKFIEEVMKSKAFFEDELKKSEEYQKLDQKDKNFIFKLCHEVFVYYTAYLKIIKKYIRQHSNLPLRFKVIMVMALVEKKHFNSPDYAIVNIAVELSKKMRRQELSGLMNATLKNIFQKEALDESPKLSGEFRQFLKEFLGEKDIQTLEMVLKTRPPLDLTIDKTFKTDLAYDLLPPQTARFQLDRSPIQIMEEIRGRFWVQDYAAANILANVSTYFKNKEVLDCCAAPGGKTRQLLSYGAKVLALDKSSERLKRLQENIENDPGEVTVLCQDILDYFPDQQFDTIILDAPCSAIGTLRKHPELQYLKNKITTQPILELQDRMLEHVLSFLKPGGMIVYCVCSMNPLEGKSKIKTFMTAHPELSLMDVGGQFVKKGFYQTFPWLLKDEGSMDGFFAAYIYKEK